MFNVNNEYGKKMLRIYKEYLKRNCTYSRNVAQNNDFNGEMEEKNMYKLTEHGIKKCEKFIAECRAKRKEILDAKLDTADETDLPTIEDIESDINAFGVDEEGDYFNGWGVTDNYNSDYPIGLTLGIDFIESK